MSYLSRFRDYLRPPAERSYYLPEALMNFNGNTYPITMPQQTLGFKEEQPAATFSGYAQGMYAGNGVVFACMERRRQVFSQARFQWRAVDGGVLGELSGDARLLPLERPWAGGTTGDLLGRILNAADLAGNAFVIRNGPGVKLLRPDWMSIISGSDKEPDQGMAAADAVLAGYAYWPGGKSAGQDPEFFLPEEVAHFAPSPDPLAEWRGMSWLTPIIREVMADGAATQHKLKFFENGATPNLVVSMDPEVTLEKFNAFVEKMDEDHKGVANAYRTLYVGGGADVKVVGSDLKQLDFKMTQGAGETRIAAAAGVPPILAGLSEGLQAATYSNYGQARRAFSDSTIWDLWRIVAGSLETIVPPPPGMQLWVDTHDIPFLQEDEKDAAEIQRVKSTSISSLVNAGYTPESIIDAVVSEDLTRLVHSGLYSVQLQRPGSGQPDTGKLAEIENARADLVDAGVVRPTDAQIAERLGVSDRTLRRWRS
jgi:phage portal protein BeeE